MNTFSIICRYLDQTYLVRYMLYFLSHGSITDLHSREDTGIKLVILTTRHDDRDIEVQVRFWQMFLKYLKKYRFLLRPKWTVILMCIT